MNGGLLDIRPPPLAPEGISATLIVAALLLMSALVLLWRYYRSPPQRARRALKRLRRAVTQGSLDNRAAAHTVAGLLRQGLAARHQPGDFSATDMKWQDFSCRLAEARFAPQPCSSGQLSVLLDEAGSWLERRT